MKEKTVHSLIFFMCIPAIIFLVLMLSVASLFETPRDKLKNSVPAKLYKEIIAYKAMMEDFHMPCDEEYFKKEVGEDAKFGKRVHPVTGEVGKMHFGYDFLTPVGSKIYAVRDGKVTYTQEFDNRGYGLMIEINHGYFEGKTLKTVYAHLNELKVSIGDEVKKGQLIAFSGNTGLSSGPHLHFEVRCDEIAKNPCEFYPELGDKKN